jgi:hypothetical protein
MGVAHIALYSIWAPVLLLAGCGAGDDQPAPGANETTSIRIQSDTGNETATISHDGERLSVDLPGFDTSLTLPKIDLSSNIDFDGIKLYPDSKIGNVDISGKEGEGGSIQLNFTSPDAPEKILDYYRQAARQRGYTLSGSTGGGGVSALSGSKAGGDSFALQLFPTTGGATRGEMRFEGR